MKPTMINNVVMTDQKYVHISFLRVIVLDFAFEFVSVEHPVDSFDQIGPINVFMRLQQMDQLMEVGSIDPDQLFAQHVHVIKVQLGNIPSDLEHFPGSDGPTPAHELLDTEQRTDGV